MPISPLQACGYPGCTALVERGRCARHAEEKPDYSAFYRSARWRREAKAFLREHPICECADCKRGGIVIEARAVDHRVPFRTEAEFWDRGNWQAMAKRCHDAKTARETNAKRRDWRSLYR